MKQTQNAEITVKLLPSGGKEKVSQAPEETQVMYEGSEIKMAEDISCSVTQEDMNTAHTKF